MILSKTIGFISVVALLWFRPQEKPHILDRIDIQDISYTKEDGSPWDDDASYPDIKLILFSGADTIFTSQTFHNLKGDRLPVYVHTEEKRIAVTTKEWRLVIYDEDKDKKNEIMHEFSFTPEVGEGDMSLKDGEFEIDLQFQEVDF